MRLMQAYIVVRMSPHAANGCLTIDENNFRSGFQILARGVQSIHPSDAGADDAQIATFHLINIRRFVVRVIHIVTLRFLRWLYTIQIGRGGYVKTRLGYLQILKPSIELSLLYYAQTP